MTDSEAGLLAGIGCSGLRADLMETVWSVWAAYLHVWTGPVAEWPADCLGLEVGCWGCWSAWEERWEWGAALALLLMFLSPPGPTVAAAVTGHDCSTTDLFC